MSEPSERELLLYRMTLALMRSCIASEGALLELAGNLPANVDTDEFIQHLKKASDGTSKYLELLQEWKGLVSDGG